MSASAMDVDGASKKKKIDGSESDTDSVGPVLPLTTDNGSTANGHGAKTDADTAMTDAPASPGRKSKRRTTAKDRTAAAPVAPEAKTGSRKRKHAVEKETPAAASSTEPVASATENAAASRIQAMIRGARARSNHKKDVLWSAWNALDWREEQELMNSHSAYEALKNAITTKTKEKDKKEDKSSSSSAPPASPKKKGRRKSAVAVDPAAADAEEIACGLLLRDKDPLTFVWVSTMMEHFRQGKQLPASLVVKLLNRSQPILEALPNIVEVSCTARIVVVGDLHGQLDDLLAIFSLSGLPSARNRYLFNGDFVDRGQHSCECILTLLAWKILMPNDVWLNRGNHEARDINGRDGFEKECLQKYNNDVEIFDLFSKVFSMLPIAHIIDSQVYVTHGGLFEDCPTLAEINAVDRFQEVPETGSILEYALWSDPQNKRGRAESPRGAGLLFGPEVTKKFLAQNGLNLIVRSHECMTKGFKYHHNDTVITVFSASNYCGTVGNDGALVIFERDGETAIVAPTTATTPTAAAAAASSSSSSATPPLRSSARRAKQDAAAAASSKDKDAAAIVHRPLKRTIQRFFAAKKEKQSAYRVVGASNLESDIITKLMHIISDHRLHLTDWYNKHSLTQQSSTGIRTVARAVWAQGLQEVLGLKIPFLEFQDLLGLPKLGVDGKKKGSIDFMAFLARFRPVNLLVLRAQRRAASQGQASLSLDPTQDTQPQAEDDIGAMDTTDSVDEAAIAPLQTILDILHKNRFELESLFRYLDYDGDEHISHDEFREGLMALEGLFQAKFTRPQIDSLLAYIDVDGDGQISYAEFLNGFEIQDPTLHAHVVRSKSIREGRNIENAPERSPTQPNMSDDEKRASLSPTHPDDDDARTEPDVEEESKEDASVATSEATSTIPAEEQGSKKKQKRGEKQ